MAPQDNQKQDKKIKMKPNIKCTWIAVIAAVAVSLALGTALRAAPLPGAIWTTDPTCSGVDLNIYASKDDVYLNGGPAHGTHLPAGDYYVQVTNPSGSLRFGSECRRTKPFHVNADGSTNCIQLCTVLTNGDPACALNGETDGTAAITPRTIPAANTKSG